MFNENSIRMILYIMMGGVEMQIDWCDLHGNSAAVFVYIYVHLLWRRAA